MSILGRIKDAVRVTARRCGYDLVNVAHGRYGYDVYNDVRRISQSFGRPVKVCFDVGANVGAMSLQVARELPGATVYAFEPVPATYAELKARVSGVTRVRPFNLALGSQAGTADMYVYDNSLVSSLARPTRIDTANPAGPAAVIRCQVATLDAFCAANGVDEIHLLKVDAEGHDLEVLKGGGGLFRDGKVDAVFVEFNDIVQGADVVGGGLAPMCEYLRPFGFRYVASYLDWMSLKGHQPVVVSNALLVRCGG